MQTPLLQGVSLDAVPFCEYLLGSAKVDIRRGEIVQGLVVAFMVVIVHEAGDLNLELGGEIVIL